MVRLKYGAARFLATASVVAVMSLPALAQSDAEKAAALRDAAAKLRETVKVLEDTAKLLDGGAGAQTAEKAKKKIGFLHALDNSPLEFKFRPDQTITPAVETFHVTAKNAYEGDEAAIKRGKKLYMKLCRGCHLKTGTGRIGPNIVDDDWKYPRTSTEKGMFEIIYAGGAGAMQAFGKRVDQDAILKVMAYLTVLRKK